MSRKKRSTVSCGLVRCPIVVLYLLAVQFQLCCVFNYFSCSSFLLLLKMLPNRQWLLNQYLKKCKSSLCNLPFFPCNKQEYSPTKKSKPKNPSLRKHLKPLKIMSHNYVLYFYWENIWLFHGLLRVWNKYLLSTGFWSGTKSVKVSGISV